MCNCINQSINHPNQIKSNQQLTCQAKSNTLTVFNAIWALRAVSFPFCIEGTNAAARAHSTVMAIPAYKWGPGNNFPVRKNVLKAPETEKSTPRPNRRDPQLLCFSFKRWPISSLRSWCCVVEWVCVWVRVRESDCIGSAKNTHLCNIIFQINK